MHAKRGELVNRDATERDMGDKRGKGGKGGNKKNIDSRST